MDTTQLLKGVLDLAVLAVVDDEDGYGYDIVRRLRDRGLEDVVTPPSTAPCAGSTRAVHSPPTSWPARPGRTASTTGSRPPGGTSSSSSATTGRRSPPPSR